MNNENLVKWGLIETIDEKSYKVTKLLMDTLKEVTLLIPFNIPFIDEWYNFLSKNEDIRMFLKEAKIEEPSFITAIAILKYLNVHKIEDNDNNAIFELANALQHIHDNNNTPHTTHTT